MGEGLLFAEAGHAQELRRPIRAGRGFERPKTVEVYAVISEMDRRGPGSDGFQIFLVVTGAGQHEFRASHLASQFAVAAEIDVLGVRGKTECDAGKVMYQLGN